MAVSKPLTYDECKAAEAAFNGAPSNPNWTEAAQQLYVRLSAVVAMRATGTTEQAGKSERADLTGSRR